MDWDQNGGLWVFNPIPSANVQGRCRIEIRRFQGASRLSSAPSSFSPPPTSLSCSILGRSSCLHFYDLARFCTTYSSFPLPFLFASGTPSFLFHRLRETQGLHLYLYLSISLITAQTLAIPRNIFPILHNFFSLLPRSYPVDELWTVGE